MKEATRICDWMRANDMLFDMYGTDLDTDLMLGRQVRHIIGSQMGQARWASTSTALAWLGPTAIVPVPCPFTTQCCAWAAMPARGTSMGTARKWAGTSRPGSGPTTTR